MSRQPEDASAIRRKRAAEAKASPERGRRPVRVATYENPAPDTEAFRRWFGDSKVVDENGQPLVVYHGAPDVRGIFAGGFKRSPMRGDVFFATDDPRTAETYTDPHRAWDYQNAEPGVIPLYLRIENPLVVDAGFQHWRRTEHVIEKARKAGHDGVIIENTIDHYASDRKAKPRREDACTVFAFFLPTQAKSALTEPMKARDPNRWHVSTAQPLDFTGPNDGTFDVDDPDLRSNPRLYEYQGEHLPPGPDDGAPLHDVESVMPDYYAHPEWYFTEGRTRREAAAAAAILAARGRPWAPVWVYRAVPPGVSTINPGDWVTTVRDYAKEHLDSNLGGEGRILKAKVRAGSLFSEGNSHMEWGWWPDAEREREFERLLRERRQAMARDPDVRRNNPEPVEGDVVCSTDYDGTPYLYHWTPRKSLKRVLKHGLRLGRGQGFGEGREELRELSEHRVFFSTDPGYWSEDDHVLLRVPTDSVTCFYDGTTWEDEDGNDLGRLRDCFSTSAVPANLLEVVDDDEED